MLRSALLAAVLAAGFTVAASAATLHFRATMDGKSEVPPKQTAGNGEALATLDTTSKVLTYTVTFDNLSGPATAAHFHGPAAPGIGAGVTVPIGGKAPTRSVQHGTATETDAQEKDRHDGRERAHRHQPGRRDPRPGAPVRQPGTSRSELAKKSCESRLRDALIGLA